MHCQADSGQCRGSKDPGVKSENAILVEVPVDQRGRGQGDRQGWQNSQCPQNTSRSCCSEVENGSYSGDPGRIGIRNVEEYRYFVFLYR